MAPGLNGKRMAVLVQRMSHAVSLVQNSEPIRVLVADSTRMNSQLLAAALGRDGRFDVLEPASDSRQVLTAVRERKPVVALVSEHLDDNPGGGFQTARELLISCPETSVVILLESSERAHIVKAFGAGARGVFSRNDSFNSLAKCVFVSVRARFGPPAPS